MLGAQDPSLPSGIWESGDVRDLSVAKVGKQEGKN